MSQTLWSEVDQFFEKSIVRQADKLEPVLIRNRQKDLPEIDVSPTQGQLLSQFVKISKAKNVLEIGTLGGYSTIWMAHALPPDGKITTLELEPHHADVAHENFRELGVVKQIELMLGNAKDSLAQLEKQRHQSSIPAFDFVFIDADKESCLDYFQSVKKLGRSGTTILVDNVVRDGQVIHDDSDDERVIGVRRLLDYVANDETVEATAVQTVGVKGYDGWLWINML